MTTYLHVRLAPWAEERIVRDYGSVSKASLRRSLRDFPGTEFRTIATPEQPREGACVTVKEAHETGIDVIELRFDRDAKVAMITLHADGSAIVS